MSLGRILTQKIRQAIMRFKSISLEQVIGIIAFIVIAIIIIYDLLNGQSTLMRPGDSGTPNSGP